MEVSFVPKCFNISTMHFYTLQEHIICMENLHSDFFNVINYIYAKTIPEINAFLSPNQCPLACDQKIFRNGS